MNILLANQAPMMRTPHGWLGAPGWMSSTGAILRPWFRLGDVPEALAGARLRALAQRIGRVQPFTYEKGAPLRAPDDKRPDVYFIQSISGGLIKIGVTGNLRRRLRTLRSASPSELRVLVAVPGTRSDESIWHAIHAARREHGEWFRPEPILLDHVAWLQFMHAAPDLLRFAERGPLCFPLVDRSLSAPAWEQAAGVA